MCRCGLCFVDNEGANASHVQIQATSVKLNISDAMGEIGSRCLCCQGDVFLASGAWADG